MCCRLYIVSILEQSEVKIRKVFRKGTDAKFTAKRMYLPLQNASYKCIDAELNYTVRSPHRIQFRIYTFVYKGRVSLSARRCIARNKTVNLTYPARRLGRAL